jgi:hypothetical protein
MLEVGDKSQNLRFFASNLEPQTSNSRRLCLQPLTSNLKPSHWLMMQR